MDTFTIDFETYFDKEVSLKKLPTILYVRHPKFKVHGVGLKINDEPTVWLRPDEFRAYLPRISEGIVIAHNALFDCLVLWEHFNTQPKQYIDTVGLCRSLLPAKTPLSLDWLSTTFGLGKKGDELQETKGLETLPPEIEQRLANYCIQDTELCYKLYEKFWCALPEKERRLMHATIRMGVIPMLEVDIPRIIEALNTDLKERDTIIEELGTSISVLRSSQKYADLLRTNGIEPPTKISDRTGKEIYAFGKSDLPYLEIQRTTPEKMPLFKARELAMGSGRYKRLERMAEIGNTGLLPMPLNYYGAHTGRWSGTGGFNVQNFQRKSEARKSIIAPKGKVIVVADSSQIELRKNAWHCQQNDSLEILRGGGDIYSFTASRHFGYEVTKDNFDERQFGKMLELALGYGMGWRKFQLQAAVGFMGTPPTFLSDYDAQRTVFGYRQSHDAIKAEMDRLTKYFIPAMANPDCDLEHRAIRFGFEHIELPNEMFIHYPNLHATEDGWITETPQKTSKVYGGIVLENIVQALARIVVGEQMLEIDKEPEIDIVSTTHDEIIAICDESIADDTLAFMIDEMRKPPTWAPDLPLDAEGGWDKSYSK